MNKVNVLALGALLCLMIFAACSPQPEPITFGKDACHHCKMIISDRHYGAELVTTKGRVYKYDALECLIAHMHNDKPEHKSLLAVAFDNPGHLFLVDSLTFIQSPEYRSPMGKNLAAFYGNENAAVAEAMRWTEFYDKISSQKE